MKSFSVLLEIILNDFLSEFLYCHFTMKYRSWLSKKYDNLKQLVLKVLKLVLNSVLFSLEYSRLQYHFHWNLWFITLKEFKLKQEETNFILLAQSNWRFNQKLSWNSYVLCLIIFSSETQVVYIRLLIFLQFPDHKDLEITISTLFRVSLSQIKWFICSNYMSSS